MPKSIRAKEYERLRKRLMALEDRLALLRGEMNLLGDFWEKGNQQLSLMHNLSPERAGAIAKRGVEMEERYLKLEKYYNTLERAVHRNQNISRVQIAKLRQKITLAFREFYPLERELADIRRALGAVEQ